jgi:hypothetical protein
MRKVGHVARMEELSKAYKALVEKPEGKAHFEDLRADRKIILKYILKKLDGRVWNGFMPQNRGQWQGLVNMVMDLRFHKKRRNS